MWGSCFLLRTPVHPPPRPPTRQHTTLSPATLSRTTLHTLSHTTLSHTSLSCNFVTHHFVTDNFVTHNTFTQLCHKGLFHTQLFHTQARRRRGTWWHRRSLYVAGVALRDIDVTFARHAWHLLPSTFTLRGKPWHLVTSTYLLCDRTGAWRHRRCFCMACWLRRSLCVAGIGMTHTTLGYVWWRAWSRLTPRHFMWQGWNWVTLMSLLCGRRGTSWHRRIFVSMCSTARKIEAATQPFNHLARMAGAATRRLSASATTQPLTQSE